MPRSGWKPCGREGREGDDSGVFAVFAGSGTDGLPALPFEGRFEGGDSGVGAYGGGCGLYELPLGAQAGDAEVFAGETADAALLSVSYDGTESVFDAFEAPGE